MIELLLSFVAGLLAAFVGVIAGGGGIISVGLLLFLGYPVDISLATNRLASLGATTSSVIRYSQSKKVDWRLGLRLGIIGIFGAAIGAQLLVDIDSVVAEKVVGLILIAMLPLILIKKDVGLAARITTVRNNYIGYVIYFFLTILGGLFGSGLGPILIMTIAGFFGKKFVNAAATNWLAWGLVSLTSTIIFAMNGLINYGIGIAMLAGMLIGGWVGAHTAVRRGDRFVRIMLVGVQIIIVIKLLFF